MFGDLYLCASTIDKADLTTRLDAALAGRYQGIGLRPGHLDREVARGSTPADVRTRITDAGLEVVEVGFLAGWWEQDEERAAKARAHEDGIFALKDAVGGRHVMLISGAVDDADRVAERLAGVCDRAADHGLVVALEALPWTEVDSLTKAWDLVQRSGRDNAGVVMDTWHHARGSGTDDDLPQIPAERIVALQLSDGPLERVDTELDDTFRRRLLPGDGEFGLEQVLGRLAAMGVRAPVGVEVLSDELRPLPAAEVARRGADATRALLARVAERSAA